MQDAWNKFKNVEIVVDNQDALLYKVRVSKEDNTMNTTDMTLDNAVDFLVEAIKEDYLTYTLHGKAEPSPVNVKMIAEFNESFSLVRGSKYIKIVKNGSVWGFIVATEKDKQFRKGDILKAAGWAAPARNKARGNVLDGGYSIAWTGPHYL